MLSQGSRFSLLRDDILSLIPPNSSSHGRDIDGNVMDALLLLLGCVASKHGVSVAILPSHFLTNLIWDFSQECLIPEALGKHHCVFTVAFQRHHWWLGGARF